MAAYFRANKPLTDITAFDADTFRTWLAEHEEIPDGKTVTVKLSESTVKRRCGIAEQFFRAAVRKRLIGESPFAHLKGIGTQSNASRFYFATKEQAEMVLAACPDNQRQLIFALSRWGGLRCPSEHLALRWCDVDLATGRMIVRCPKTEQHQGKSQRTVPIFPELRPYLEDTQGLAADGAEFVITRYRDAKSNLRTHMERIIKKAGLKLFQNMRSTRQTELAERFPAHVVCQWIGNSPEIAREHYLQSTVAHFEAAAALHNPVQEQATVDDNKLQPAAQVSGKAYCLGVKVGGTGLDTEHVTSNLRKDLQQSPNSSAAQCGAFSADFTATDGVNSATPSMWTPNNMDADLASLIDRWSTLSDATKAAIVALVTDANVRGY